MPDLFDEWKFKFFPFVFTTVLTHGRICMHENMLLEITFHSIHPGGVHVVHGPFLFTRHFYSSQRAWPGLPAWNSMTFDILTVTAKKKFQKIIVRLR